MALITERELTMCDGMAYNYSKTLPPHIGYEEMRGVARLALAEAAHRHVQRGEIPFSAYAALCIKGKMRDYVRRQMRTTALDTPVTEYMDRTFSDPSPSPEDIAVLNDTIEEVLYLLELLPDKYQIPVREIYLHSRRQADVARDLGVAQSTVTKRAATGILMLRRILQLQEQAA